MPYTTSFDQNSNSVNFHAPTQQQQQQQQSQQQPSASTHHNHHHNHANNNPYVNAKSPLPATPNHLVFENKTSDPKTYLKSYYDHRYSSYEPMLDYLNFSSSNNNAPASNTSGPTLPVNSSIAAGNREQQVDADKKNSTTVNGTRRQIKIKNLDTGSPNKDDADFKAFKEKFNLNANQFLKPNAGGGVSNRHSINIDDLTNHGKHNITINLSNNPANNTTDITKKPFVNIGVDKPKTPMTYAAFYNNNNSEFDRKDDKSSAPFSNQSSLNRDPKKPAAPNKTPINRNTIIDSLVSGAKSNDNSPSVTGSQVGHHTSSGVGKDAKSDSTKESPLFQKIMAKLAEVPDSILLKSYKSTQSNQSSSTTPNLKNISTKSIDSSMGGGINGSSLGYGDTSLMNSSLGADFSQSKNVSLLAETSATNPFNSATSSKSSVTPVATKSNVSQPANNKTVDNKANNRTIIGNLFA
jgi:hypothetical protein